MAGTRFSGVALATCLTLGVAACSDGDGSVGGGNDNGSGADASGVAEASAAIDELAAQSFSLEPLSETPPTGQEVAFVNCTVPACNPGRLAVVGKELGWNVTQYPYDFAAGPQGFVSAHEAALASEPDYLVVAQTYPNEVNAEQIAQAEAAGIPVVTVAGEGGVDSVVANVLAQPVYEDLARTTAQQILTMAGGPVEVVLPLDPTLSSFADSVDAFEAELLRLSPGSKVDRLELSLASPPTQLITEQVTFLRTHPDAKYLAYLGGTALFQGVHAALESSGLGDQVQVVFGWATNEADAEAVANGEVEAAIVTIGDYSWMILDILARISVGDPIDSTEPAAPWLGVFTQDSASPEALNPPGYQDTYRQAWQVG